MNTQCIIYCSSAGDHAGDFNENTGIYKCIFRGKMIQERLVLIIAHSL